LYLSRSVLIFLATIGGRRGNLLTANYAALVLTLHTRSSTIGCSVLKVAK
jgi:hypothetical protein